MKIGKKRARRPIEKKPSKREDLPAQIRQEKRGEIPERWFEDHYINEKNTEPAEGGEQTLEEAIRRLGQKEVA